MKRENILYAAYLAACVALVVCLVVALSLNPIRDHLREQYGLQLPEWYDEHPADDDGNRAVVAELLAETDRKKAAMQEALKPKPQPELSHGRRDSSTLILPQFWGSGPLEPPTPRRLADRYQLRRSRCHSDYGWLDRNLDLCKDVDKSADAAVRYADDVQSYWTSKLRPILLPFP